MYSQEAVLQYVQEQMGLDIDAIKDEMARKKNNEILQNHNYSISQGKDRRWRTYVTDETKKSGRRQIAKKTEEALLEELQKYYSFKESERTNATLNDLYGEWIEHKRKTSASETNTPRVQSSWGKYYANTDIINIPVKNLTRAKLKEWACDMVKSGGMDAKQYANFSLIIRQILDYAVEENLLYKNPYRDVHIDRRFFRKTKKKDGLSQVYSPTEKNKLTKLAMEDFRINTKREKYLLVPLAIIFQFETGMRVGEICALKYGDIEEDGTIHVQRMYQRDTNKLIESTKTDAGDRFVVLTDKAKNIIKMTSEYQRDNGYIENELIFSVSEKPLEPYAVNEALKKYCKKLGITYRSSHKVRKTYATNLIDGGADLSIVREQLGHADETTTLKHYYHNDKKIEEQREIITQALLN